MNASQRHSLVLLGDAAIGAALFAAGPFVLHERLGIALWAIVAAIVLLPLADAVGCLHTSRYSAASVAIVVGVLLFVGVLPAIVLVAVAWSLLGGVQILHVARLPTTLAIAATMLGTALSLTWPIWMAGILSTHDLGSWLQRMIDISPAFALNAAIARDDPLTHRPLAYRLMNLGQDVNYAMPQSVWPCVLLHAGVGAIGLISTVIHRRWTRSGSLAPVFGGEG